MRLWAFVPAAAGPSADGEERPGGGVLGRLCVGDGRLSVDEAELASNELDAMGRLAFIRSARARAWSGRVAAFAFFDGPLDALLSPNMSLSRIAVARARAEPFFSGSARSEPALPSPRVGALASAAGLGAAGAGAAGAGALATRGGEAWGLG